MNRFLPKSLFGQTLLVLLVGLIISHAAGSWIYSLDLEQAVRVVGGFAVAQRITNLTAGHPAPVACTDRCRIKRPDIPRLAFIAAAGNDSS